MVSASESGGAGASDCSRVCMLCLVRTSRPTCPECGKPTADLLDDAARLPIETELRKRMRGRPTADARFGRGCMVLLTLSLPWVAFLLPNPSDAKGFGLLILFLLAVAWGTVIFFELNGGYYKRGRWVALRQTGPHQLALVPGLAGPDPRAPAFRGRVRIVAPARAPVSGRLCAAVRIEGEGPTGRLDDAMAGTFEVDCPGVTLVVEPGPLLLDVPTEEPIAIKRVDSRLRRSLAPYIAVFKAPFELAEGLVEKDAEVTVVAAVDVPPPVETGYRSAPTARLVIPSDRGYTVRVSLR